MAIEHLPLRTQRSLVGVVSLILSGCGFMDLWWVWSPRSLMGVVSMTVNIILRIPF